MRAYLVQRPYVTGSIAAVAGLGLFIWACMAFRGPAGAAAPNQTQVSAAITPPAAQATAIPMMARTAPPPTAEPAVVPVRPVAAPPPAAAVPAPPAAVASPVNRTNTSATKIAGFLDPALTVQHRVAPGENLRRIAAKYRITPELLALINGLQNKDRIAAGTMLTTVNGPFKAVVDKAKFCMDVYLGDAVVKHFQVGLGSNGSTPRGSWRVKDKLTNPSWSNPKTHRRYAADDPANPIGEHWLGLEGLTGEAVGKLGFGIHGTIEPDSIGREASLGCVRMLPADVAFVYSLLVDGASTVEIR